MLMNNYARCDVSFVKGKGAVLFDKNGKKYIDFASGIGVCSLGHANKIITKAIKKQSKKLLHTSNLFQIKPQIKLANKFCDLLGENYFSFFANSGAEANECAIKLARKFGSKFEKKRYKILSLKNSFHGRTLATLKLTGQEKFHQNAFAPYPDGFYFYDNIEEIIANLDDEVCAVFIELIQGEGGVNPLKFELVKALEKEIKSREILLITDEVQCGVYRSGEFVTSQIYGISADIITLAKGLGGGLSIGACLSKFDIFTAGDHGSTFGGNFLATKVALKVLKELEKMQKSGDLSKNIENFAKNLDEILQNYPEIFEKRVGIGLMQGLVLKDSNNLTKITQIALQNGLIILKSGTKTLRFLPPLNIKKREIEKGFLLLKKSLDEI